MSRSNQDKYDGNNSNNANNRRQYRLMSAEEVAAGKKSFWTELEITGIVRNLSPEIWKLTHLTSLYLNDNHLTRLPTDISKLVNLTSLDLSHNKLRSLPQELGELIYLRELQLCNNLLRSLPYEIGKLFHLQVLGLQGNPLNKECWKIYNEPNGTHKLLSFLLDSLQGKESSDSSQSTTTFCNCRYCDPEGVVWDIRQRCFSPNLMPPAEGTSIASVGKLAKNKDWSTTLKRSCSEPASKPSSTPVVPRVRALSDSYDTTNQNLQVSSEIVTSLNGHRDIEIKFFSSSTPTSKI